MRAAHVTGVRQFLQQGGPLLHPNRDEDTEDDCLTHAHEVDPLLMGLRDISAAVLDLAKAAQVAPPVGSIHPTVEVLSAALLVRVKWLSP